LPAIYLHAWINKQAKTERQQLRGEKEAMNAGMHPPALVLNADFRPLSYFPLSLWSWQDSVKAVFLDRVTIISEYEEQVSSPSMQMKLPSVIALKEYIPQSRHPAFTRFNVFLRDKFTCQYCDTRLPASDLTFDHVVPRSKGGRSRWDNVVAACIAGCAHLQTGQSLI
jgi:5-methylcytosine-specific restriction endonuclease McrA